MQADIRIDIQRLKEENERLRQKIEENERRILCLESRLVNESYPTIAIPKLFLSDDDYTVGFGDPPVPNAIPARTYRDSKGNIQIALCRTYCGEGWIYTPVADGWVLITRENE